MRLSRMVVLLALLAGAERVSAQINSSREYIYMDGKLVAVEAENGSFSASIPTPVLQWADHGSGNSVQVYWCASNASSFDIERTPGGITTVPGGGDCITWTDNNVVAGRAYTYRVRARDASGHFGPYSNQDLATVVAFTNDRLTVGVDFIRAAHFNELRQAVASVRELAGLGAPGWAEAIQPGVRVMAAHMNEIRGNLDPALARLQLPALSYTDSIVPGVTVKAAHVQEIRDKVR